MNPDQSDIIAHHVAAEDTEICQNCKNIHCKWKMDNEWCMDFVFNGD